MRFQCLTVLQVHSIVSRKALRVLWISSSRRVKTSCWSAAVYYPVFHRVKNKSRNFQNAMTHSPFSLNNKARLFLFFFFWRGGRKLLLWYMFCCLFWPDIIYLTLLASAAGLCASFAAMSGGYPETSININEACAGFSGQLRWLPASCCRGRAVFQIAPKQTHVIGDSLWMCSGPAPALSLMSFLQQGPLRANVSSTSTLGHGRVSCSALDRKEG